MNIEAMKQALEALEVLPKFLTPGCVLAKDLEQRANALRAAIADAEKKHLEEIENVMLEIWQPVAGAWNPVNTAPQPQREWADLSDELIDKASWEFVEYEGFQQGARWAQTKLKEKNT